MRVSTSRFSSQIHRSPKLRHRPAIRQVLVTGRVPRRLVNRVPVHVNHLGGTRTAFHNGGTSPSPRRSSPANGYAPTARHPRAADTRRPTSDQNPRPSPGTVPARDHAPIHLPAGSMLDLADHALGTFLMAFDRTSVQRSEIRGQRSARFPLTSDLRPLTFDLFLRLPRRRFGFIYLGTYQL
jgi:hypothetical protein